MMISDSIKIEFPENHQFLLAEIFGESPRIKILEFFIYTYLKSSGFPWTYISQLSRILELSKSSVKKNIDDLIEEGFLVEKKTETHAQNPKRDITVNKNNLIFKELIDFYKNLKFLL